MMAMSFVPKYAICQLTGPLATEVEPVVNARVHVAKRRKDIAARSSGLPGCRVPENPRLRMP